MSEERLVTFADQGRLAAVLHVPARAPGGLPCPVVIYCPGKNGERYEVHRLAVKFARRLAAQGIAFFRFDYYGMGLSDGEYYEMTTSTKVSNVERAYAHLQDVPEVDLSRAAYLGFSDGARIALLAARHTGVTRLALWSPLFYEFGGNFPLGKRPRFYRHPLVPGHLVMPWAGLWIGMPFYRDLERLDVKRTIAAYDGSSLVGYGDDDPLIEEEFAYLQTDRCALYDGSADHQVLKVAGAGHLFTSLELERQLMDATAAWLESSFSER